MRPGTVNTTGLSPPKLMPSRDIWMKTLFAGLSHHGGLRPSAFPMPVTVVRSAAPPRRVRCRARRGSAPGVVTASSRAIASAPSATSPAPMFSSRCAIDRVPANQQRVRRVGQQPRQPDLGRRDAEFARRCRPPRRCRRPWGNPGTPTRAGSTAPRRCPRPYRIRASPPASGRAGCRRSARRRSRRAAPRRSISSGTLLTPIAPILPSSRSAIISASWSSRSTIWSPSALHARARGPGAAD